MWADNPDNTTTITHNEDTAEERSSTDKQVLAAFIKEGMEKFKDKALMQSLEDIERMDSIDVFAFSSEVLKEYKKNPSKPIPQIFLEEKKNLNKILFGFSIIYAYYSERLGKEKAGAVLTPAFLENLMNRKIYSTPSKVNSKTPSIISLTSSLNFSSSSIALTITELHS